MHGEKEMYMSHKKFILSIAQSLSKAGKTIIISQKRDSGDLSAPSTSTTVEVAPVSDVRLA